MATYGNGEETKRNILETSARLFLEKGYENTTYEEICREAHVNKGSIYYHFKAKKELLRQVCARENDWHREKIAEILAGDSRQYMEFLLDIYVFWFRIYEDEKFRKFIQMSYKYIPDTDYYGDQYFWENCKSIIPYFDNYFQAHKLDFAICNAIDAYLIIHVSENLGEGSYIQIARYEIEAFAKLFRLNQSFVTVAENETESFIAKCDLSAFIDS